VEKAAISTERANASRPPFHAAPMSVSVVLVGKAAVKRTIALISSLGDPPGQYESIPVRNHAPRVMIRHARDEILSVSRAYCRSECPHPEASVAFHK